MAEAPVSTPSETAPAAEAPAPSAPEPSGSRILAEAKQQLREVAKAGPTPADQAAQESAAEPPEPPAPAPAEEKPSEGTRRDRGLRERIRQEVRAEFEAEQRAAEQRRQNEQQQREFDELVARADAGDFEAKDRVLNILKSNRGMQAAIAQGRQGVLEELGRDITQAVYSLEGLDDEGQQALMQAASVADFGKVAFDYGRRSERAIHESTIATLKAENESLKGRLAGNSPSPTATNGQSVSRGQPTRFASMRDAFVASAAELGYRSQQG